MLFVGIMLLTGLLVTFGIVDNDRLPPVVNAVLGQDENYSWYDYFRIWNFRSEDEGEATEEEMEEEGWWSNALSLIANVGSIIVVGGATAIGALTKNDAMLYSGLIVTIGGWFMSIWWAIVTSDFMMMIEPLNYLLYGVVSLVFWWSLIEWLRGKL